MEIEEEKEMCNIDMKCVGTIKTCFDGFEIFSIKIYPDAFPGE